MIFIKDGVFNVSYSRYLLTSDIPKMPAQVRFSLWISMPSNEQTCFLSKQNVNNIKNLGVEEVAIF